MTPDKDHQAVFGHLAGEHFTAAEVAEYLEIPESALQALISTGRLHPTGDGRFPVPELKALKQTRARKRYTLQELLNQCDASSEISAEDRAWINAPAVGHELSDDDEDRRIDAIAAERVATFDPATAITHEELLRKYGVPSESGQEELREVEADNP